MCRNGLFFANYGERSETDFFAIKNKKGEQAKSLRAKLIAASQERDSFLKSQKKVKS